MSDDDRSSIFEATLAALSGYFVGDLSLAATLQRVAELSLCSVPVAVQAGITLTIDNEPTTVIFTSPEVPEMDQAQYQSGEGPCLQSVRDSEPHLIPSTKAPGRWQAFRDAALSHGILSTMSLPMKLTGGSVGALNFY